MEIYRVQAGDTVNSIAYKFNIPARRLEQDNNLAPGSDLNIGEALIIARPAQTYMVQRGDTLGQVAERFGVTVLQLLRNNPQISGRDPLTLNEGEVLVISYNVPDKKIEIYGYANEFISEGILKRTLPYLTYLAILNYRITAEGTLIDINDATLIETALKYGVAPIMFASSITEQGVGNNSITHAILIDPERKEKLINNLLSIMRQKGYYGLELTFVDVFPEDLELYITFISEVTLRFNEEGYPVFISLLPSTFGYTPGTAYESTYYSELGNIVNYMILISFLWSNASISQVSETTADFIRAYTDFAVTRIPPEKIFLGLNRMSYDWELPYEEGRTPGRLITNLGAISLASQLGVNIQFDDATQTPFFYYTESGIQHFVWFKDAQIVQAMADLVTQYGLKGIAVWNIMYYYNPVWLVINTQYNIVNVLDSHLT